MGKKAKFFVYESDWGTPISQPSPKKEKQTKQENVRIFPIPISNPKAKEIHQWGGMTRFQRDIFEAFFKDNPDATLEQFACSPGWDSYWHNKKRSKKEKQ